VEKSVFGFSLSAKPFTNWFLFHPPPEGRGFQRNILDKFYMQSSKIKKYTLTILKILFTVGIFYYLIQGGQLDLSKLRIYIERPALFFTAFSILLFIVLPLSSLRWKLFLQGAELPLKMPRTIALTWIGNFFNSSLPGAVSGDVIKGFYVVKHLENSSRARILTTLLIDRFTGLFGLIIMAFIGLVIQFSTVLETKALQPIGLFICALFLGVIVFYVIVLFPFKEGKDPIIHILNKLPLKRITLKVYQSFKIYEHHKGTLFFTLIISVLVHTSVASIFFMVTNVGGFSEIALGKQLLVMPIGLISTAIPIAPGGIGVGHVAFQSLYKLVGFQNGADIFNLFIIIQLIVNLLGGIPYFLYNLGHKRPTLEEMETQREI
jgi:uncharacterized protein (TIRG00374 family)